MPLVSTLPQLPGQAVPERLQWMVRSGLPLVVIVAWKACSAPSSTLEMLGEREREMSLVTVTAAVEDFVASAWLVAVTCTVPPEGRSAGAV